MRQPRFLRYGGCFTYVLDCNIITFRGIRRDAENLCADASFCPADRTDYEFRFHEQIQAPEMACENFCLDYPRNTSYASADRHILRSGIDCRLGGQTELFRLFRGLAGVVDGAGSLFRRNGRIYY